MDARDARFLSLVRDGFLTVDANGAIWRNYEYTRSCNLMRITRRRAECVKDDGYARVRVAKDGKREAIYAHRLVWLATRGDIPNGYEVNHENGKRNDNRPENLTLLTPGQNTAHSYRVLGRKQRRGMDHPSHILSDAQVKSILLAHAQGAGMRQLSGMYGVGMTTIRRVFTGQRGITSTYQREPGDGSPYGAALEREDADAG